jgi:hypothetical protein
MRSVAGSGCLQCATQQEQSEFAAGISDRANRSAVHLHGACLAGAGKGVSQEIAEALQLVPADHSCRLRDKGSRFFRDAGMAVCREDLTEFNEQAAKDSKQSARINKNT